MIDEEFKFRLRAEPTPSFEYNENRSQLGDGYSVSSPDGINNEAQSWTLSATSSVVDCKGQIGDALKAFSYLRERKKKGESFPWRTPFGELIRVEASNLAPKRTGDVFTLSTKFTQVFR